MERTSASNRDCVMPQTYTLHSQSSMFLADACLAHEPANTMREMVPDKDHMTHDDDLGADQLVSSLFEDPAVLNLSSNVQSFENNTMYTYIDNHSELLTLPNIHSLAGMDEDMLVLEPRIEATSQVDLGQSSSISNWTERDLDRIRHTATMMEQHRPLSAQQAAEAYGRNRIENATSERQWDLISTYIPQIQATFDQVQQLVLSTDQEFPVWSSICSLLLTQVRRTELAFVPPDPLPVVKGLRDEDGQGICFQSESLTCSRRQLQEHRYGQYKKPIRAHESVSSPRAFSDDCPSSDAPFRFARTHGQAIARRDHFQLRHLLAVHSTHDAFFSRYDKVYQVDPVDPIGSAKSPRIVMDIDSLCREGIGQSRISTLNKVGDELLMTGNFKGYYSYCNVYSDNEDPSACAVGKASESIVLSVDSTSHAPNAPMACLSINDHRATQVFIDCARNEIVKNISYMHDLVCITEPTQAIVNCTATSPDGSLRACVGDFCSMLLTDARTGLLLHELPGLSSDSFTCAWSPSGYTIATGSEDNKIRIWETRMLKVLAFWETKMSSCRTLCYSPLGAGPLTLFAGENVDLVHVIDARTTQRLQIISYLGDNLGMGMSPCGSAFMLANGDPSFGGLMVYDRTTWI